MALKRRRPDGPEAKLRVLMSFGRPSSGTNPFTYNLASGLCDYVEVEFLSPATMLWRPFDILHVHWPDNLFRATGWKTIVKTILGIILMMRARLWGRQIIYTKHNVVPHERPGRLFGVLYRWVERSADVNVYLNESTENDPAAGVTILHGDYPAKLAPVIRDPNSDNVEMLLYGQLRRYKGVEALLSALAGSVDPRLTLRIRGAVPDASYGEELASRVGTDRRVDYRPGFIEDDELERALSSADLVVLPYSRVYNSGAALLALSRGLPILVPNGPSMRSLRDEVGDDFVHLFDGELSSEDLERAREIRARTIGKRPDLSRRDWHAICELHSRLYSLMAQGGPRSVGSTRRAVAADASFVRHSLRNTLVVGSEGA